MQPLTFKQLANKHQSESECADDRDKLKIYNAANSSVGLVELLLRHGVTPTCNSKKDIALAKRFMPCGYNE